jgi:hypothetical protein
VPWVLLLALAGAAAPAAGHDFWIEPSTYTPAAGELVALRHRVGEHFLGDAVPRDPSLLRLFAVFAADGERPVAGRGVPGRCVPERGGGDPAGYLRATSGDGALLVAYEGDVTEVDLSADKLVTYLAEEGLEPTLAERRRRGLTGGARDAFSRHVKSLLHGPAGGGAGFDRVVGLALELVPERDPGGLRGGGALPVRLLFAGQPLAGARVTAIPRLRPHEVVQARTDARGGVTLPLATGEWLVKAVHLVPQPGGRAGSAYRSYWASLTFRVPGPTP